MMATASHFLVNQPYMIMHCGWKTKVATKAIDSICFPVKNLSFQLFSPSSKDISGFRQAVLMLYETEPETQFIKDWFVRQ